MNFTKKSILVIVLISTLVYSGCENNEEESAQAVDGTYVGTLSSVNAFKDELKSKNASLTATTEILTIGKNTLQIHCYNDILDTTFVMNYYHHRDSDYVCYIGTAFRNAYGHMIDGRHMGWMMADIRNGETEWTHHMNDEHKNGDKHYGGFNMKDHSFDYTFTHHYNDDFDGMRFHGTKRQ